MPKKGNGKTNPICHQQSENWECGERVKDVVIFKNFYFNVENKKNFLPPRTEQYIFKTINRIQDQKLPLRLN
jgi:hypothetical protein